MTEIGHKKGEKEGRGRLLGRRFGGPAKPFLAQPEHLCPMQGSVGIRLAATGVILFASFYEEKGMQQACRRPRDDETFESGPGLSSLARV